MSLYREDFEEWWKYWFIRNLYGLTHAEMAPYSNYIPSHPFIEAAKAKAYGRIKYNTGDEQ